MTYSEVPEQEYEVIEEEEPKKESDLAYLTELSDEDMEDLFDVDDVVESPEEETEEDMADLTSLSKEDEEDLLGTKPLPPKQKKPKTIKRVVRRQAPPPSLGSMKL